MVRMPVQEPHVETGLDVVLQKCGMLWLTTQGADVSRILTAILWIGCQQRPSIVDNHRCIAGSRD